MKFSSGAQVYSS